MQLQQNFEVELIEKELITVELKVIDILNYYEKTVETIANLKQEVPTHISGYQFQTSAEYSSGTLRVFLNGIKEKISQIQEDSTTKFTFLDPIDISLDCVEVSYVEKD